MGRRMKGAIGSVILIVVAVGAIAVASPSAWREAEDTLRWHLRSVEAMARPAAERSADWFERQTDALRYRLGGTGLGAGKAVDPRENEEVRIARAAGAVSGSARVIDGDTLDVGGVRIRLHGIDAPESGQSCRAGGNRWSCGRDAARALAGRIGGRSIACQERDRDRYGRVVAVCSASGMDLNAWMVAEGWAFAYRRYSKVYVGEESAARAARRGVWRGEVVRLGSGARASALAGRGQRLGKRAADGAASRATSARAARASTTFRAGATTTGPESTRRRGSGGFAPRTRHERRDGAARGNSPHPHEAAPRRPRVRRAATVAGRWNRAPRSVPDISRGADATLLEPVYADSGPEARLG